MRESLPPTLTEASDIAKMSGGFSATSQTKVTLNATILKRCYFGTLNRGPSYCHAADQFVLT